MKEIVIIGGGIFGSVAAAALRKDGHEVVVIDAQKENAGSKPAACLMKPSWFSSMGKDKFGPSLDTLDELYGVHDLSLKAGPLNTTVHWCDPAQILQPADLYDEVEAILATGSGYILTLKHGGSLEAKKVVVAAGVWSSLLTKAEGLVGQAGCSFRWQNMQIAQGFIKPWAPYKQNVAFNISPTEVWVGDGSAIKPENWDDKRQQQTYDRCAGAIDRLGMGDLEAGRVVPLFGLRPYIRGVKPCLIEENLPGLWVNTGGAKNGTISAGYAASVLREALK